MNIDEVKTWNNYIVPLSVIIGILLMGNLVLGILYTNSSNRLAVLKARDASIAISNESLTFLELLIDNLLKVDIVDDGARIELETAAREVGDEETLTAWKSFVGSDSEREAQEHLVTLMSILVQNINEGR